MALNLVTRYGSQAAAASPQYPQGAGKNDGTPGDQTGTPLDKDWYNDVMGLLQALIVDAGITISGNPDTADNSDYKDALDTIIANAILAQPGPSTAVNIKSVNAPPTPADYNIIAGDVNTIIRMNSSDPINIVVPTDVAETIAIGETVMIHTTGLGQVTIVAAGGVTLETEIGLKSRAQHAYISLTKEAANTWGVSGALVA